MSGINIKKCGQQILYILKTKNLVMYFTGRDDNQSTTTSQNGDNGSTRLKPEVAHILHCHDCIIINPVLLSLQ